MPCSKAMRGCKTACLHRRFVLDYVAERDAQSVRAEGATAGHDAELADYFGAGGRPVEEQLTFKRWLITRQGCDYPYLSTVSRGAAGRWMMPDTVPAYISGRLAELPAI